MVGCCECNGWFHFEGMYIGYGYDHDTTRLKTTILVPMKYFCVMKYLKIMVKSQLKVLLKQLL
jgi:hypothetical protein